MPVPKHGVAKGKFPGRTGSAVQSIYQALLQAFGPQHWWPGDTPFEIIVGAILTQNTNWGNVEKAIANLKHARMLTPAKLYRASPERVAELIKPSGYFNVKTKRLRNFLEFLFSEYQGSLDKMKEAPLEKLREQLLQVTGIGPETADSILLYAFGKRVFVVDTYTKRVFYRHGLVKVSADYHQLQELLQKHLQPKASLYNQYHALLVRVGKEFCKPRPRCAACPLVKVQYALSRQCPRCFRSTFRTKRRSALKDGAFCEECHSKNS